MVDAQLTFSQNWGKRSPTQGAATSGAHGAQKSSVANPSCAESYTESLLRLHELMVVSEPYDPMTPGSWAPDPRVRLYPSPFQETYANYQQCQRAGDDFPSTYGRL